VDLLEIGKAKRVESLKQNAAVLSQNDKTVSPPVSTRAEIAKAAVRGQGRHHDSAGHSRIIGDNRSSMEALTCHLPGWNNQHQTLYRRRSTPAPPSVFAATERFTGSLTDLFAEARPQIERARQLGLLKFAEVADDGKDSQAVE
jgi:hypothetical protein